MKKKSPGAALVALRWGNTTPEQRKTMMAKVHAAVAKPTECPRCGEIIPTARGARAHCRKKRAAKDVN